MPAEPTPILLPLAKITLDPGCQSRVRLDDDTAREYAADLQRGAVFPPVIAYHDGSVYWLADGSHRWHGHKIAGHKTIRVIVHKGTRRDAMLHSAGSNQKATLPRTDQDKRRAVGMMLDDPEWVGWKNTRIADHCGVSEGLVRIMRKEREPVASYELPPPVSFRRPAEAARPVVAARVAEAPTRPLEEIRAPAAQAVRLALAEPCPVSAPAAPQAPQGVRLARLTEAPLDAAEQAEWHGRAARLVRKLCRAAGKLGLSPEELLAQYRTG